MPTTKRKSLMKKCWKLMSLWRRIMFSDKNGYVKCITCGKICHFKEMNAGHLRHGVLDFDPINIHPQCTYCNKYQSGKLDIYYKYVIDTYGQEAVDDLYKRASMAKKGQKIPLEELEKISIDLTLKCAEEMEKRGISKKTA